MLQLHSGVQKDKFHVLGLLRYRVDLSETIFYKKTVPGINIAKFFDFLANQFTISKAVKKGLFWGESNASFWKSFKQAQI